MKLLQTKPSTNLWLEGELLRNEGALPDNNALSLRHIRTFSANQICIPEFLP